MEFSRRALLIALLALLAPPALATPGRHRHPHRHRLPRARRRAVRRRRTRRRAFWRVSAGHRLLVVPLGIAVGWELLLGPRVMVVTQVHADSIEVEDDDGSTETLGIEREDNAENSEELEGSEYEVEIDEEVAEDPAD